MLWLFLLPGCQDFELVKTDDPANLPYPVIEVDPDSVSFTDIGPADGVQVQTLTITNAGGELLELDAWTVEGSGDWTVLDEPESTTLYAGEDTTMRVAYTPTDELGEATLWVESNDPATPETPVALWGSAVLPELVVSDVDFGEGYVDCPLYSEVTIENVGTADAELVALGTDDVAFTLEEVSLPATLAAGDWLTVAVTWTPDAVAPATASTTVEEATLGEVSGDLDGEGTGLAVEFGTSEEDFGQVYVDCDATEEPRIYNRSTCEVTLTGLSIDSDDYALESFTFPRAIPAETSVGIDLTWYPLQVGAVENVLTATFDEVDDLELDVLAEGILDTGMDVFDVVEPATEPVYLHDTQDLYTYDPTTGTLSKVGRIGATLYDIAIDAWGQIWGVSTSSMLYQVDAATGVGTAYMSMTGGGNGMAVLQDGTLILTNGTALSEVDWSTGTVTQVASSPSGSSSGDIVEWDGLLYWTVTGSGSDHLLEYDPSTATMTDLGATGASGLWGIVAPDGDLIAFSSSGTAYWLDSANAAYTSSATVSGSWYGAAHNPSYGSDPGWTFHLTQTPRSEDDIDVDVNGTASTDWTLDTGDVIDFEDPSSLAGGDVVTVVYGLASTCE